MPGVFEERQQVGKFFYRFPCGESGADVYDRVSGFLETLFRHFERKDMAARNVVIVTHGLFIRLFLMRYFRLVYKYTNEVRVLVSWWERERERERRAVVLGTLSNFSYMCVYMHTHGQIQCEEV